MTKVVDNEKCQNCVWWKHASIVFFLLNSIWQCDMSTRLKFIYILFPGSSIYDFNEHEMWEEGKTKDAEVSTSFGRNYWPWRDGATQGQQPFSPCGPRWVRSHRSVPAIHLEKRHVSGGRAGKNKETKFLLGMWLSLRYRYPVENTEK